MTKIITIANQKGGCAKTTTVVNLAASLAALSFKVLVIDIDPQCNATEWLGLTPGKYSSEMLFENAEGIENIHQNSTIEGVSAISSSYALANLASNESRSNFIRALRRIRNKKEDIKWDIVLIDTPPTLSLITLSAMLSSDLLLIPVSTHVLSLSGVTQLIEKYKEIKKENNALEILGFLPTRVDNRTRHSKEVIESLKEHFGNKVLRSHISESIKIAECPSFTKSILEYKRNSKSAIEFMSLGEEVKDIITGNPE